MKTESILKKIAKEYGNTPFEASHLYGELNDQESIDAFYQSLSRLVSNKQLIRLGKGTYCKPKISIFGLVPPDAKDIMSPYIENDKGMVIGYELFNALHLTTQVPKRIFAYSSALEGKAKTIGDVHLEKVDLTFSPEVKRHVQAMEVLNNIGWIEDFNENAFSAYIKEFVYSYSQSVMDKVLKSIRYKKATIALLKEILDSCQTANDLSKYLNPLTKYKTPNLEGVL